MAPINLSSKHQDLLKAYFEVSKTSNPDWTSIATKADFPTAKYARDQFTIVKNKLLATANGDPINLSDRQIALLKAAIEVMKGETEWEKVASTANFKTPKYARDQWTIVKTKLCGGKVSSDAVGSTSNTPKKVKAGKTSEPRKRKKRDEDESAHHGSADEDELQKATRTPKKKKKKARKSKVHEPGGEGHDGSKNPIPSATPVTPKQEDPDTDCELHDYLEGSAFEAAMSSFE